ncbi:hypothetical protein ES708_22830 [subsurface metagenome]
MKIGFLITARLKSTRLPKKIILKLNGREVIRHMIDRLKLSNILSNIIICTSNNAQDKPLIEIAKEENIDYFLGDEDDVIFVKVAYGTHDKQLITTDTDFGIADGNLPDIHKLKVI